MMDDKLKATVVERAKAHGLNPVLVMAVVEQESGWEPWAIHYESVFFERYIQPLKNISATEAYARAFSFGLMQVMGQTARELGFSGRYLSALCDPFIGAHFGCLKLVQCYAKASGQDEGALLRYNGGGNPDYANQVLARVAHYQ